MAKYLEHFMSYRCAADIIGTVGPMKKFEKEISEAVAIENEVRNFSFNEIKDYTVIDLCSGNALVPLMTAFMLPVKESIAVDIHPRGRDYSKVRKFSYLNLNIHDDMDIFKGRKVILTACHACKDLAKRIIDLYNKTEEIEYLVLSPCCIGTVESYGYPEVVRDKLGKYLTWAHFLFSQVEGTKSLKVNTNILSPCNAIITATKKY